MVNEFLLKYQGIMYYHLNNYFIFINTFSKEISMFGKFQTYAATVLYKSPSDIPNMLGRDI